MKTFEIEGYVKVSVIFDVQAESYEHAAKVAKDIINSDLKSLPIVSGIRDIDIYETEINE